MPCGHFMKLKISRSKNSCTLYVQKAYRDKTGKSTSKIVERLGSLDEVRARAGAQDPVEWAKAYVQRLTAEEKEQRRAVMPRLHPSTLTSAGIHAFLSSDGMASSDLYHAETYGKK